MKSGNTQCKASQEALLKLKCVLQDLQDQLEDLTEQSNEIQEIMGRSYGMPEVDDDELEAELEALGDEIALDDDTSYLDEASKAPNAPTAIPGAESVTNKVMFVISFVALYFTEQTSIIICAGSCKGIVFISAYLPVFFCIMSQ